MKEVCSLKLVESQATIENISPKSLSAKVNSEVVGDKVANDTYGP